jgi:hypothetical protein
MNLNERRLAAANELYSKLNICGEHIFYSRISEKDWVQTEDGFKREVRFEEDQGAHDIEHSGSFSVTFEKGTSILSAAFTEIEPEVTYQLKGKRLQDYLRAHLPHLASPFNTAVHMMVSRNYAADYAELSKQGIGAVTTKVMAQHMLTPFQTEFGMISALSFRRNETDGTYQIEIRIPLAGFPDDGMDLSEFSPDQLVEAIEVGEAFEGRVRDTLSAGTLVDFVRSTVKTPTHSYVWSDVLDAQRTYDIRNGINLKDYDADEVAAATVLQIGDYAVIEDGAADCYVVARIDEDGLCLPLKGDLSYEDAEAMLQVLTKDADPVLETFSI